MGETIQWVEKYRWNKMAITDNQACDASVGIHYTHLLLYGLEIFPLKKMGVRVGWGVIEGTRS